MKNAFYLISFCMLVTVVQTYAQYSSGEYSIVLNEKGTSSPLISWKKNVHDFGTIEASVPVSFTFEFVNTGQESLLISEVKTSCGCTATNYSKAPILPGKASSITATYNAKAHGAFAKTIQVISNSSQGIQTLTIKGIVK